MSLYSYFHVLYLFMILLYNESLGSSYNVVVVEYGPNLNNSLNPNKRLEINVKNYIKIIEESSNIGKNNNKTVDLIIFPESTLMYLNSFSATAAELPSSSNVVLCNSSDTTYPTFLKELSCAAIQYNTTIIINFTEKQTCPLQSHDNCPELGDFFYNTNVALASNGSIIARYRKWNLFGEYGKSKPNTLDLPIITINNATFGMMTCFDIQFQNPAFTLTKDMKLKNIIFPLNWISELPYLTALQVQQMWAQEFNVVLLAAGASNPSAGAGGSGIFMGNKGILESEILAQHGTKLIFQTVPENLEKQNSYEDVIATADVDNTESIDRLALTMDKFYMLVDPSIKDHKSVVLNTTQNNINTRLCHGTNDSQLCCDFNISFSVNETVMNSPGEYYTYHLVVFNGIRTYSQLYYGGVETCGVVACLNSSLNTCGQRFSKYSTIFWPVTFNSICVKGSFPQSEQRVQFATTLLTSIRPLPVNDYKWEKEEINSTIIRTITLQKPQTRLLSFGIFGRHFERDWDPIRNDTLFNISNKNDNIRIE